MQLYLQPQNAQVLKTYWRGGRVVMQQIANLSTVKRRQGSSPCLSAETFRCSETHLSKSLFTIHQSGCSVARSSRLLWEQEVAGSNPATPTNRTYTDTKTLLIY